MADGSAFGSGDRVVNRSNAGSLLALILEGAALAAEARPSVSRVGRQRLRRLGWQAGPN